jgi:hypothetical protein
MSKKDKKYWVSLKNGEKFPYEEYSNIETPSRGYLPLPMELYPWTIESDKKEVEVKEEEMVTISRREWSFLVARSSAFESQLKVMTEIEKLIIKTEKDKKLPYYEMLITVVKEKRIR